METGTLRPITRLVPWGLTAMVGLLLAIEILGVRRDPSLLSLHATSWRLTAKQLDRLCRGHSDASGRATVVPANTGPEILCFGDSLVKFGVYPRVLEKLSGMSAYNLAITTGPAPATYFLFRRVLERGGKPKVIILDTAEWVLDVGPRSTRRVYPWADLLTSQETADLAWTMRDPDFFVRTVLNATLRSFNSRFEIRESIKSALSGMATWRRNAMPAIVHMWAQNQGAHVNVKVDFREDEYAPPGEMPGVWSADPVNLEYLERLFALAARHGVAVFWLLPPYHPQHQSHSRYRGEERRYTRLVEEMRWRHPEVVVVDGRYSGYDRTLFLDDAHLDSEGGTALSCALAEQITAYVADPSAFPKWSKLPEFRTREPDVQLVEGDLGSGQLRARGGSIRR